MEDQERKEVDQDLRDKIRMSNQDSFGAVEGYREETSAELAPPLTFNRREVNDHDEQREGGRGLGLSALALSIMSLFIFPILFGAAGIVLGFMSRRRGATSLGSWAIGIGAISIVLGMFILPFF